MKEKAKKVLMWIGLGFMAALAAIVAVLGLKKKESKLSGPEIARRKAAAWHVRQELARRKAEEMVEDAKRSGTFADSLRRDGAGRPKS